MMKQQTFHRILTTRENSHGNNAGYYEDDDNDARWIDTIVSCAQTVNKLFTSQTCRLCHVYSDRQVEYENSLSLAASAAAATAADRRNQPAIISPVERAYLKTTSTTNATLLQPEVEFYRQFLFDEESVVQTVYNRTGDLDA
jgi:hypothetical protein